MDRCGLLKRKSRCPCDGGSWRKVRKKTARTIQQPTEEQARQLAALDEIRDEDIDLSDIPEQAGKIGWVRGAMYRPVMKAISIRLPASDLALARQLALRKGVPYQTYVKGLLHDALGRERKREQP